MKYLILSIFILSGSLFAQNCVTNYPYIQHFEHNGNLPANWQNDPNDDGQDWELRASPTPSTQTGPSADHTSGYGFYAYVEDSFWDNDEVNLLSPCYDLNQLLSPMLSFWVHSYEHSALAINENELHIDVWANGQWNLDVITPIGNLGNQWVQMQVDLSTFSGQVQVRFRVNNNNNSQSHDIAIDDVYLENVIAQDAAVEALLSPLSQCGLGANEPIQVEIRNEGVDTLVGATLSYSVNGGMLVSELVSTPIPPNEQIVHTFSTTADFSASGAYQVLIYASHPNDINLGNDSLNLTIENPLVNQFPYVEDFEEGGNMPIGWENVVDDNPINQNWLLRSGSTPSFNTGPINDHTTNSISGFYAYVEDSYFEQDSVILTTPCFDLSNLNSPRFSFWFHSRCSYGNLPNFLSYLHVDILVNGHWQFDLIPAISHQNAIWNEQVIDLSAYQGVIALRFRVDCNNGSGFHDIAIDDVRLDDVIAQDAGVVSLLSPISSCGLGQEMVEVEIENFGTDTIHQFDVSWLVNGGNLHTESINQSIPPHQSQTFSFNLPIDLSTLGPHDLNFFTQVAGDTNEENDSLFSLIENIEVISTYPYTEDFEAGSGGWHEMESPNSSWELGTPNNSLINAAASGANAWVTNLDGDYNPNENSAVISPCLDFSSLSTPVVELDVWWESEFSWDGAVLQSSVDGGTTWQNVGAYGDPDNWYNDFSVNAAPGGSQDGWSGQVASGAGSNGWLRAKHQLDGLGGEPLVKIRIAFAADASLEAEGFAFDNLRIYELPPQDVGITQLISPQATTCGEINQPVEIVLQNSGSQPQFDIPIELSINHQTALNYLYTDTLAPASADTIWIGNVNNAASGIFGYEIRSLLPNDTVSNNDALLQYVDVTAIPDEPFAPNVISCKPDSLLLTANGSIGFFKWYDSPTATQPIELGNSLQTPYLTQSRTYYVEANDREQFKLGAANNSIGNGGFDFYVDEGLLFDVFEPTVIDSVTLYPSGAGIIQINIEDSLGTLLFSEQYAFHGTVSDTTLYLGATLSTANHYKIHLDGSTVQGFYRNTAGATYPYQIQQQISIHGPLNNIYSFYYFFYNWSVSTFGCSSNRIPVEAIITEPPIVDLGPDAVVCAGFVLDGMNSQPVSYQWSTGETSPNIIPTTSDYYHLTVQDSLGCVDRDTVFVDVLPVPVVDLGNNLSVCGAVALDAGNPDLAYVWSTQDESQQIFVNQSGQYWVAVSNAACTVYDTVQVTVNPGPSINLGGNVTACDSAVLDVNFPGADYQWTTGDESEEIVVHTSGPVEVLVSQGNCAAYDSVYVTILEAPQIDLGDDRAICDTALLVAGPSNLSYQWSTGSTSPQIIATPGTYSVWVSAPNGCIASDLIVLSTLAKPNLNLGPDRIECDSAILFTNYLDGSLLWSTGDTNSIISVHQSGTYHLIATNNIGCSDSDMVEVTLLESPQTSFNYDYIFGNRVDFSPQILAGTGPFDYLWEFGDGSSSTQETPIHFYLAPGTYTVNLTLSNDCGSSTWTEVLQSVAIEEELLEGVSVYPNPNEGRFSVEIDGLEAEQLEIYVEDIRGREIFSRKFKQPSQSFVHTVEIPQIAEGLYILRIEAGQKVARQRIVVR